MKSKVLRVLASLWTSRDLAFSVTFQTHDPLEPGQGQSMTTRKDIDPIRSVFSTSLLALLPDTDSSSEDELSLCFMCRLLKAEPVTSDSTSAGRERRARGHQCQPTVYNVRVRWRIPQWAKSSHRCEVCAEAACVKTASQSHQTGQSSRPNWTGWWSVKIGNSVTKWSLL